MMASDAKTPKISSCPDTRVVARALEQLSAAVVPRLGAEPALLLLWARWRLKLGAQWVTDSQQGVVLAGDDL